MSPVLLNAAGGIGVCGAVMRLPELPIVTIINLHPYLDTMPAVKVSEEKEQTIEDIRDDIEDRVGFRPSKKSIVENAIEYYYRDEIDQ